MNCPQVFRIVLMLVLGGILQTQSSNSQSIIRCGVEDALPNSIAERPEYIGKLQEQNLQNRTQNSIFIPVVFHVVYNTPAQNIPVNRIMEQLQVLNDDFNHNNADTVNTPSVFAPCAAATNIWFCLAEQDPNGQPTTGILNVPTFQTSFTNPSNHVKMDSMGGSNAWPTDQYLNIWICNLTQGIIGFGTYPGTNPLYDGLTLHYQVVGGPNAPGTMPPYNLGRTATHEIGHWLGLPHFNYNCNTTNTGPCQPPQQSAQFGCPSFPQISCNNGPNGDMFMNFMQVVDDDCMNLFNSSQATLMNATLNNVRNSLITSVGCIPVGLNENVSLDHFSIYPIPFSDELTVESEKPGFVEATLYDISGRKIFEEDFTGNTTMKTGSLSKGFYLLELVQQNVRVVKKISKE